MSEHIAGMGHFFARPDFKKHTYLAIPEQSVLKEGILVDLCTEALDASSTSEVPNSVLAVATGITLESKHSTTQVIKEQAKALHESEATKEKAKKDKLATSNWITPDECKAQQEQYRKLEESENEQGHEVFPWTTDYGQHHFASGQQADLNRNHTTSCEWQTSVEQQAAQVVPFHQTSHSLEVGTAVELVDPPGYGTIRWIGKFPGVDHSIAGVEMVSCAIYCLQSVTMLVLTL